MTCIVFVGLLFHLLLAEVIEWILQQTFILFILTLFVILVLLFLPMNKRGVVCGMFYKTWKRKSIAENLTRI